MKCLIKCQYLKNLPILPCFPVFQVTKLVMRAPSKLPLKIAELMTWSNYSWSCVKSLSFGFYDLWVVYYIQTIHIILHQFLSWKRLMDIAMFSIWEKFYSIACFWDLSIWSWDSKSVILASSCDSLALCCSSWWVHSFISSWLL